MTVPKFTAESDGPLTLRQRAGAVIAAVRAWAATEVGGWIIIGVLAVLALGTAGAAVILPRINAADPALQVRSTAPAPTLQLPAGDLTDFTLAPEALQKFDFAQARLWNAALPFSTAPIRPAAPLIAPTTDIEAYSRALDCLTTAIYYEAASETPQGQAAVAQVVLNRARHPAYPRTVCGVVFQGSERTTGCQFSFTCDGAMARVPSPAGWARARGVASAALNGTVVAAVGTATHYHTDWVAPYWAPRLSKIVQIGTHIFYRWNGAWGLPSAFTGVYSGAEPIIPKMASLATFAVETPVEILVSSELDTGELTEITSARLTPVVTASDEFEASEVLESDSGPAAPVSTAPVRQAPVIQRDVPIMADPMASPATPTRQRQRIAAPSGW
ncbi:MAG: cell wall hydrolase [Caulobacteraceae bacterium]|nr:cell wall hydrolase [Caulobacteraceae bacterium]